MLEKLGSWAQNFILDEWLNYVLTDELSIIQQGFRWLEFYIENIMRKFVGRLSFELIIFVLPKNFKSKIDSMGDKLTHHRSVSRLGLENVFENFAGNTGRIHQTHFT